jgi:outer membrane murein-binding lipoprotein Lpp
MKEFLLVAAIVLVVMVVVGFIGNKIVDGATNAVRSGKAKRDQSEMQNKQPESLAARYNARQPARPTEQPQQTVPRRQYCTQCGQRLPEGAAVCTCCGSRVV